MRTVKTEHLFAGAGGGLLADLILGHEPIFAVEQEPYACQVLRERAADGWFPELRVHEGDVRLFDPSQYAGSVDCIHAGFPCQDISVAGKQAGVGEETRSGLYREVLRIADVVRPRYLFLENVAAILNCGGSTVISDLAARGYVSEWLCLRASDCGAPHHRDRWWCLAIRNTEHDGQPAAEISGSVEQGNDCIKARAQASEFARPSEQCASMSDTNNARSSCARAVSSEERTHATAFDADRKNDVYHPSSERLPQRSGKQMGRSSEVEESERSSSEMAYPDHSGLQGSANTGKYGKHWTECRHEQLARCNGVSWREWQAKPGLGFLVNGLAIGLDDNQAFQGWWGIEPKVGRVTETMPNRAAMLKCLGNGQVPVQAAVAWRLLGGE